MAGTLVISTISDGTNSTSSTNAIQGSAKAWVNFNGMTTATIRASYNVSSVTRNAAGDYTINFTTALADANYSISGSASSDNSTTNCILGINQQASGAIAAPTTTSARVIAYTRGGGAANDVNYVCVSIFR